MSEEKESCCEEERPWWKYIFHLFGRRTIMAYAFSAGAIIGFLRGLIDPAKFAEMVMLILAYYFMTRNEKEQV